MRILHIVPTYFPATRYGGPIESVKQMNATLVKKGVSVTVFTTNADGDGVLDVPLGVPVDVDGVEVFYFPVSRNLFLRKWFYSQAMRRALKKRICEFDLVHITSVFLAASFLGSRYARKFKKPYIISPRGNLMVEPLAYHAFKKWLYIKFIERFILKNASALHFTVEKEEEEYKKTGLPLKKSFVASNGVDVPDGVCGDRKDFLKNQFNIAEDKKIVLFLGRISWKKGFDTLVPAFAQALQKNSSLVLVVVGGDDEGYLENIKNQIFSLREIPRGGTNIQISKSTPLEEHIIFTGELKGDEKWQAFCGADVFILPSYSENFGMAVVEAMACGVPVVVSDGVGIWPVIKECGAGIVVKKEEKVVAEALIKIFSDDKLRVDMGQRARECAKQFAWERVADMLIDVYKSLCEK